MVANAYGQTMQEIIFLWLFLWPFLEPQTIWREWWELFLNDSDSENSKSGNRNLITSKFLVFPQKCHFYSLKKLQNMLTHLFSYQLTSSLNSIIIFVPWRLVNVLGGWEQS
jgi:hypothetical protein